MTSHGSASGGSSGSSSCRSTRPGNRQLNLTEPDEYEQLRESLIRGDTVTL
ncbi:uncharacterized protein BO80DRAFT_426184, partial [Aspergillus ibericus CBS 121593]